MEKRSLKYKNNQIQLIKTINVCMSVYLHLLLRSNSGFARMCVFGVKVCTLRFASR